MDLQRLSRCSKYWILFQIVDDILDITATQEELGKTAGKDLQAQSDLSAFGVWRNPSVRHSS